MNKPRITIKAGAYRQEGKIVGRSWLFEIKAKLPNGKETSVAHGSIKLKPNPAEPGKFVPDTAATLDFMLDNQVEIDHRQYRIKLEGQEKLNDYVMKEAIHQFENEFHSSPDLGGSLAWDNKASFQHAYAEVVRRNPGISSQDAAQAAILKTPYGNARDKAGYAITVNATGSIQIVTGDPPRLADVPENVTAIAKPKH